MGCGGRQGHKPIRRYCDTDMTQEKSQIQKRGQIQEMAKQNKSPKLQRRHTRWDDKLGNIEGKTLNPTMRGNLNRNRKFEAKGIREHSK